MTLEQATNTLIGAGFAVGDVKGGDGPNDVVADTNPGAGTLLQPGNSVDLRLRQRNKVPGCR
jgi:beta-lactam-binding protein with PASTA domain